MILKCIRTKILKKVVKARSYRNYDFLTYKNMLMGHDWNDIIVLNNPNAIWNNLCTTLKQYLDILCPIRRLVLPIYTPEWLTPPIIEAMRHRDDSYRIARRVMTVDSWRIANFNKHRVAEMIFNSRKNEIGKLLVHRKDDPTKFWEGIRKLLPNKTTATLIKLRNKTTNLIIPPGECAEYINSFFSDIGKNLAQALPDIPGAEVDANPYGTPIPDTDLLFPVTHDSLMKLFKNVNVKKPSSIPHMKAFVLKDAYMSVPDIFLLLYNKCLSEGTFPHSWKAATVVPLHKKANSLDVNDLRPISLLPLPGKIMEKIICNRLQNYMQEQDLLCPFQHGYRKNHSTQTAIGKHLSTIVFNTINNSPTYCLYLDYKKAFDTISHKIMLKKLAALGLSDLTCQWFKSYLVNRKQCTIANDCVSPFKNISYGVPQGSVLGPVLFSIYINSLPKFIILT